MEKTLLDTKLAIKAAIKASKRAHGGDATQWREDKAARAASGLAYPVLQGLCKLLVARPDFNLADRIIGMIVKHMDYRHDARCSEICCDTAVMIFDADVTGETTLSIVRAVSRLVKQRSYTVVPVRGGFFFVCFRVVVVVVVCPVRVYV